VLNFLYIDDVPGLLLLLDVQLLGSGLALGEGVTIRGIISICCSNRRKRRFIAHTLRERL
jgi:hypothetical protein